MSAANNSFKPNLLRYGKSVAEKACHAFASTTQVGLTQALAVQGEIVATLKEAIVRSESVAREFNLKEPVAREIVMEQTRQALLRSWLAWAIFLVGLGTATWLFFGQIEYRDSAIWVVIGTVTLWHLVGRYQAGQAIRKAAHEKSTRMHGMHS